MHATDVRVPQITIDIVNCLQIDAVQLDLPVTAATKNKTATTSDIASTTPPSTTTSHKVTKSADQAPQSLSVGRHIPGRWIPVKSLRTDDATTPSSGALAVASKRGASAWTRSDVQSHASTINGHVHIMTSLAMTACLLYLCHGSLYYNVCWYEIYQYFLQWVFFVSILLVLLH